MLFKAVIEEIRVNTGTRSLTENKILAAINYITYETVKDERIKIVHEEASGAQDVGFLGTIGITTAEAACPATIDPNYKQVRIDIDAAPALDTDLTVTTTCIKYAPISMPEPVK